MLTRKKTYNNIARSVRSKPSHLVYLFFFPKNGTKIRMKDIEQNIFTIIIIIIIIIIYIWNMVIFSQSLQVILKKFILVSLIIN